MELDGKHPLLLVSDGRAAYFAMKAAPRRNPVDGDFGERLRGLIGVMGLLPATTAVGQSTGKLEVEDLIRDAKILDVRPGHLSYRLSQLPGYDFQLTYDAAGGLPLSRHTLRDAREVNREDWLAVTPGLPPGSDFTIPH